MVEVVLVLMFHISSGNRDMANVGGVVISRVGIFGIFLWCIQAWIYLNIFYLGLCCSSILVLYHSRTRLYSFPQFYSCFKVQQSNGMRLLCQCISHQNHLLQGKSKLVVWCAAKILVCGWLQNIRVGRGFFRIFLRVHLPVGVRRWIVGSWRKRTHSWIFHVNCIAV